LSLENTEGIEDPLLFAHGIINIHANNEEAFRLSCEYDNLEIVKFLLFLEESHGKINIHAENELAFRCSCYNGHLEIVKILLSLEETHGKIDIHVEYDFNFKCTYKNKKYEIIKLLIDLDNYKDLCIKNNYKFPLLMIQLKENNFKNIIKKELDECVICGSNNKYFFEYQCNKNHLICQDCFYKCEKCYFCREYDINCNKVYLNEKLNF
jgi:hypothetical protein